MNSKDKSACFFRLSEKLKKIDLTIDEIEAKISEMKTNICQKDDDEEVCPDELEGDKAILELLKEACVEEMINQEPEGES